LAELGSQRYDFSYFDTSDAVKIEPRNFERWAISASDPILYKPADVDGACQSMNFEVEPRRATGKLPLPPGMTWDSNTRTLWAAKCPNGPDTEGVGDDEHCQRNPVEEE
jgi:hypothetical protein